MVLLLNRTKKKEEFRMIIQSKDPYDIGKLFVLPWKSLVLLLQNNNTTTTIGGNNNKNNKSNQSSNHNNSSTTSVTLNEIGIDWSSILNCYFDAYDAAECGNGVLCYEYQSKLHTYFNQLLSNSNVVSGNALIPALHTICYMTHKIALLADRQECYKNNNGDMTNIEYNKLQNAVTLLQESFSRTYNDRTEWNIELYDGKYTWDNDSSKKAGVLYIVNQLFSIYFRLNTLRLCKNLVRPIEQRKLHSMSENPKVQQMGNCITYKYYVGRIQLFEDNYMNAEQNLQYALQHCYYKSIKNQICILRYLIPIKLYHGHLPTMYMLQKYKLYEFIPLVNGIRQGNLRTFHNGLIQYQHRFIKQGTYLLLEKCKTICYRNLFKRIHYCLDMKPQIPLNLISVAFQYLDLEGGEGGSTTTSTTSTTSSNIDLDEIECILANLIYKGYVRGYLSHSKRVLVLSKRDPFPISSVIVK